MTRAALLTALALRLNKDATTLNATTQARLLTFLNERQRRLLTLPGLRHLRDATITVDSVASQPNYVLANIAKIQRFFETTNDRVLWEMSQQDYRLVQPDTTITGTPEAFVWLGQQAVATPPSDASSLFVTSTSAADTTQTVYVDGVVTGSYPASASVTLTGVTAVNLSTALATWIRVDKFYLSAVGAGTITLHEDSGAGTELARIPIGQTSTNYAGFALYPTPSAAITYAVDITRAITDLAQSTDVPVLPEDFHDVLLLGSLMDEYQHLSDDRYAIAAREYQQRVNELKYWLSETSTGQRGGLVRDWDRPSQLGPWYPPGT
jgi:hypothetical protein